MGEFGTQQRRRLAIAAAPFVLLLAGCASSTPPDEPAPELSVSLERLAGDLGLHVRRDVRYDRVLLESPSGDRISARAGTATVTVRGSRFEASRPLEERGGSLWLAESDARTIQGMWHASSHRRGTYAPVPRGGHLTVDDLPPRPVDTPAPGPAWPATAPGNLPSPAERAAWGVPIRRSWDFLVMHHSATASGNAAAFHKAHLEKGWDGLGYHFVIGNGHGSGDGQIEVGWRWTQQREGAHAGNDTFNQRGIGICLVGDFTASTPTAAQMRSLQRLSDFLSAYCGIPSANLRYHRDVRDKSRGGTDCPGKLFPTSFRFQPQPGIVQGAAQSYGTR